MPSVASHRVRESSSLAAASPGGGQRRRSLPRLAIREMVLSNFKSYAGEQRVGPFHKSFSAVVGPNGSGKSNVIDAMLFVFGKRAKQMRLNKVSELIHNSTNHQNLNSASVSVLFQEIVDLDDGSHEVVDGTDFTITRTAFRDNSSKYYINDRGSNFTEVTKKLKAKGVDLDNNRFLILQGEVEQVSLMKPKAQGPHDEGFLEYLEDIIGTNQYVEKIEESYKELESLNEKRSSVVQMVKLAEKERDNLEAVKNEAESFVLKELTLLKWQEKATVLVHDEASSKVDELQGILTSMEENLKMERDKIRQTSKTLKDLELVHNKYLKRQEELDSNLRACKEDFKEFERQDVKYREDLKHMKQKIKKLEDKLEKDFAKIEEIEKESEESTNLITKLEEEIPKLQLNLLDEEKLLEEIQEQSKVETEKYRSGLAEVRAELEPWEKQLIEHGGKYEVACTECKLLKEKHDNSLAAFEDAKKQRDETKNKIKSKTEDLEALQLDIEKHSKEALEAHKVEQDCVNQQESLIPRERSARQRVTELMSVMESEKSQGSVLKAILHAKETKQIEGIHGRLGDLGAIDAKFDIAISTACPGLDYIVVETTTTAQACVDLLRRKNLGVATFLILEKQVHYLRKLKEKANTPEGVPRLFDLVKVADDQMKLAFFALLQNTVVAKDLDQATRIAYGGSKEFNRVVTLDGALFEKSGTMSGGGRKPRGGKMGTSICASVSSEGVAQAGRELAQIVDELSSLRHKISDAVRCYQAAEKAVYHLEMEVAKCQKEIDSLNAQYSYIGNQLDSLKAASRPSKDDQQRIKDLDDIISSEENELEKLREGSRKLKEKASDLQDKIEHAGGERLKNQKLKVKKIQSEIDKSSSEINRQQVQINTGNKMVKKLTKAIEESKVEKERINEEKEKLMFTFKEVEQKAFVVQENYKKTQELLDKHKDALDGAKMDYNTFKKTVDDARDAEVDAEFKLQDAKKLTKEWEMKEKGYSKRLDDIKNDLGNLMQQIQKDGIDLEKLETTLNDDSLKEPCDLKKALEMVALLEAQLKDMSPNLDSISEYRKKASLYGARVEELNLVTQEIDDLKKQYDELRKRRLDEFMVGFNTISLKLKEMYQMITLGGDAELELVDSLDPFSEGVVFSVRPPKKSWKNIVNLSGGEKRHMDMFRSMPSILANSKLMFLNLTQQTQTLSSLALVFALHHYKPTPLYVMDEIDAALDFKNVSIVGHYVKDRTKDAQFIIISLRNNMFELADCLVGIYKTDNCTKSITINPRSFAVSSKVA